MLKPDGRAGKITAEQVRRIRRQAHIGNWLRELIKAQPTLEQIADQEGVTLRAVRSIVNGQRYQWVKD
jgi:hypothetical protein